MKLYAILLLLLAGFFVYLATGLSIAAPSCTFRSGSCNSGELCVFSVFQENNSHVANCTYYNTKICCNETTRVAVRSGACLADEEIIASESIENNTHVASRTHFNTKICAKFTNNPAIGIIRDTACQSTEACIASVFQENDSHIGSCNYYTRKLCLRELINVTITINLNTSEPSWGAGLRVTGNITRADGSIVDTAANRVNLFVNNSNVCNTQSDSTGEYTCDFTVANALGTYLLNVSATDPLTNKEWTNTTTYTVKGVIGITAPQQESTRTVSCYEEPTIVQEADGSLKVGYVRICISR